MFLSPKGLRILLKWSANFFLLASLLLQGCTKKEALGSDLLPNGTEGIRTVTLTNIQSFSLPGARFRSDEDTMSINFLGAYRDPFCGSLETGFLVQYALPFPNDIPADSYTADSLLGVDSVILQLPYASYYGNASTGEKTIRVKVYKTASRLYKSSTYYSDWLPENYQSGAPLADLFVKPDVTSSITGTYDTVPMLKIRLNPELGEAILSNGGSLRSNDTFQDWFRGLLVTADAEGLTPNRGGIVGINLFSNASRLMVFGRHKRLGNVRVLLNTGSDHAKANYVRYRRLSGSGIEAQFADTSLGQNGFAVMGMGAVHAQLKIPALSAFEDSMPASIHKAELIISGNKTFTDVLGPVPRLALKIINTDNSRSSLPDESQSEAYNVGGKWFPDNTYRFAITRYIQDKLIGGLSDKGLYLSCYDEHQTPSRAVLAGGNNISIRITYKRIK